MFNELTVFRMMAETINSVLGCPGNVLPLEITTAQRCRMAISDMPIYPSGIGYLVIECPRNFVRVLPNNDIITRELSAHEIKIYNGKTPTSTKALIHTNIFEDGHPCLGSGPSAVRIKDTHDFMSYIIASFLRNNMTGQSFLSPTTRKYGSTVEEMQQFKEKVKNMLSKHFSDDVVDMDYLKIRENIHETFNDLYRIYAR